MEQSESPLINSIFSFIVRINGANYIFTHLNKISLLKQRNKDNPRLMFRKLGRRTNPFPSSPRKNWIDRKN